MSKTDGDILSEQYQQKTDKEHILDNPDTYIGSVETVDSNLWVFDNESNSITLKTVEYVPGLYKLFDGGIVNCRDHVVRMINSPILNIKNKIQDIFNHSECCLTILISTTIIYVELNSS